MGASCSCSSGLSAEEREAMKREQAINKEIMKDVDADKAEDSQVNKLLLLGAGESGKSTLFKQMIAIYGTGYPDSTRATFQQIIYNNIITSMQALLNAHASGHGDDIPIEATEAKEIVSKISPESSLEGKAEHFKALWADKGIQQCYENRNRFQLTDSANYFFDDLDRVCVEGYLPTQQDVLRSRVRTTGIVENSFEIDGNQFKMFDVGGQRNERKKWIHCFENVTGVLFVGVLSEYDLVLYEDESMNRMEETLKLFYEICNSKWFSNTAIILFLNKRDLFEEKLTKVPLNVCPVFKDVEGEVSYEQGCELIEQKFNEQNEQAEKQIYCHVTCATDTTNITAVFNAVKDIIIRKSLGEAGLV